MGLLHNDVIPLEQQLFTTLSRGGSLGFLTDASVAASTDRASLKRAIRAVVVPNDVVNMRALFTRAVDYLQDSDINNSTTVAALAATTGVPAMSNTTILE